MIIKINCWRKCHQTLKRARMKKTLGRRSRATRSFNVSELKLYYLSARLLFLLSLSLSSSPLLRRSSSGLNNKGQSHKKSHNFIMENIHLPHTKEEIFLQDFFQNDWQNNFQTKNVTDSFVKNARIC